MGNNAFTKKQADAVGKEKIRYMVTLHRHGADSPAYTWSDLLRINFQAPHRLIKMVNAKGVELELHYGAMDTLFIETSREVIHSEPERDDETPKLKGKRALRGSAVAPD